MTTFIVIPTYNEKPNISSIIDKIFSSLPGENLVIVDDNSPDGTGALIEELKKKYPRQLHCIHRDQDKGYGPSCLAGFQFALSQGAKKIIQMDADGSHDPATLPHLVNLSERYDLVLGSRYTAGGGTPDWPLFRKLLSRSANLYARTILGLQLRDITTGFRCFNRKVLESLDLNSVRSKGYGFLTEMVYQTHRAGFSIGECPIIYRDRTLGKSKMGLHIAFEGAVNVLKMRL